MRRIRFAARPTPVAASAAIASIVVMAAVAASFTAGAESAAGAAGEPLSLWERIALARLAEIRPIADSIQKLSWPDFDATSVPAVFCLPDGRAVAAGFSDPPAGFTKAEDLKYGERPVFRAAAGAFRCEGRSPALVAGQWAVLSRIDPPEADPHGAYMGRPSAEEALAGCFRDAFLVFLMRQRKTAGPFSVGAAAYPETAELMALTTMENRAIVAPLLVYDISERNIEDYRKKQKQAVAIRHARWKLIGTELAALEKEIENTEGLALYTGVLAYRQAANRTFTPSNIGTIDPTFREYAHAFQERVLATNYPLSFTVDNPATTLHQVVSRAVTLASHLDRIGAVWRPAALPGDTPLVDALAIKQEVKPEDEPALLESAKADYRYDALVALAEDDLARVRTRREALLRRFFPPGPDRLEIRLKGGRAAVYRDDPDATGYIGEGRLTHPGGLTLEAGQAGELKLVLEPAPPGADPQVMTRAGARRDAVEEVIVRLDPRIEASLGGKRLKTGRSATLTAELPLVLKGPGLDLRLTAGTLGAKPDGTLQVDMNK